MLPEIGSKKQEKMIQILCILHQSFYRQTGKVVIRKVVGFFADSQFSTAIFRIQEDEKTSEQSYLSCSKVSAG